VTEKKPSLASICQIKSLKQIKTFWSASRRFCTVSFFISESCNQLKDMHFSESQRPAFKFHYSTSYLGITTTAEVR